MKKFNSFSLLLTENCNFACRYCYEINSSGHKNKNMTPEIAKQTIKFMFNESDEKITASFFGGEPTLMPEIIDIFCTDGKILSREYKKKFEASIITNASIMNKQLYDVFKKHLDIWTSTQLSIDGDEQTQNTNRVLKNGKGSFDIVIKNIKYYKELFGNNLNVHGILNHDNVKDLYNNYKFFKYDLNIPMIWFLPAKDNNFNLDDVKIYDEEMNKIYEHIMSIVRKTNSLKEIEYYAPLDRALKDNSDFGKPCGAGESYCTITSDGLIWPCHHFYFIDKNKEMCLGDIWNGVDIQKKLIWDEYDANDIIGCFDCNHYNCYRCIAENYEQYGNPFKQIKNLHCEFMLIDLKYQNLIKKEIKQMGLLKNDNENNECDVVLRDCVGKQNSACDVVSNDCVGKIGECPVVTSLNDCKFERNTGLHNSIKDYDDIENYEKQNCCNSNNNCNCNCNIELKELLNDVIEILVKFHNKL